MQLNDMRNQRRRLLLTQRDLARLAGVSQPLIWKIEQGGRVHPLLFKAVVDALTDEKRRQAKQIAQEMGA